MSPAEIEKIVVDEENKSIDVAVPAEIEKIVVDEENKSIDVAVSEDQLSQAIGRGGQNVRLASELTGWNINVMTLEQAEEKSEAEAQQFVQNFVEQLDVDEDLASVLVAEDFTTIEEIAYVPEAELLKIEEFDEDVVQELRQRARDALLTQLIANEEELEKHKPAEDLLNLEGMDEKLAYQLAAKGIETRDDLAELAVDELTEITDLDDEKAGELIMQARQHWFE